MQKYNKNIRRNVLGIVSKRLLPQNQGLYFARRGCQECIRQRPSDKHSQHEKIANSQNSQLCSLKQQSKLSICSNLYAIFIENKAKQGMMQENREEVERMRDMEETVEVDKNQQEKQQELSHRNQMDQQLVVSQIADWLNFCLQPQKHLQSPLPHQTHPILQKLKQALISQPQPQSQSPDPTIFESQTSTYILKKSTKIPNQHNQSFPNQLSSIQEDQNRGFGEELPRGFCGEKDKGKYGSLKLFKSASTISSERNVGGMGMGEMCYDELMRVLLAQASTIESML